MRLTGVTRLNYDEIDIGSEGPERHLTLTRADLVQYAGASGEFNPVHHDEPLVQATGMPSVFGHGMFSRVSCALPSPVGRGRGM